jgi:ABC-type spermidine/putrescine transport system permease subunit II
VNALSVLVYVFLLAPLVVVVLASFNAANYLSFPPRGFSLRWYRALWESEVWADSFRLSLLLCAVVTPLALAIGTLAAYALGRYAFPGRGLVSSASCT